jgi:hypothetical protein
VYRKGSRYSDPQRSEGGLQVCPYHKTRVNFAFLEIQRYIINTYQYDPTGEHDTFSICTSRSHFSSVDSNYPDDVGATPPLTYSREYHRKVLCGVERYESRGTNAAITSDSENSESTNLTIK